ncbi:MAG TPA: tRNA (adenosine(37)-N6)-threonylcarbamoyltransferase complex ATPase subunit type 1 TsaE [Desulfatiglandales bacterium]|nr:tRNA (adenosine(37)-N6)-threonylcarbamoyltransferase complex ATPase subunit type 1 TsaE [Desulfatiglandales bacterium]
MKEISVTYLSSSVEKTVELGQQLGSLLTKGDVIALIGDLGGGKTWFTKGLAIGLGIERDLIVSPTFTLVNEYQGRLMLFHIDLYRLKNKTEILGLDLEEYLTGEGVVVIEWANRWPRDLPKERIRVDLKIVDENIRELKFFGDHFRSKEIIRTLKEKTGAFLQKIK